MIFTILMASSSSYAKAPLTMEEFVAHGGGRVGSISSTNSLEALNYSYSKGFKFFEIDFEWTSDKELVLIHDWKECLNRLFHTEPKVCSLKEFKSLKMADGLTQMDLKDLAGWIISHTDAHIITDIKSNNMEGLTKIAEEYPDLKSYFIPQIYKYEEYDKVKKLGFGNIILTLYVMNYPDKEVMDFLISHKVSALTMWHYRANQDFVGSLKKMGVFIYAHTVNDPKIEERLKDTGVDGFYTDFLGPGIRQ